MFRMVIMFKFSYFRASILWQQRRQTENREENIQSGNFGHNHKITEYFLLQSKNIRVSLHQSLTAEPAEPDEPAEPAEPDALMPRCVMDLCSAPPQVGGLQPSASLQPHGRPGGCAGRQRDLQRRRSVQIRR